MQAKLRCAIYTRVSTDNQAEVEFNPCEAQESKIKSFIKSQENLQVFKVYSDQSFEFVSKRLAPRVGFEPTTLRLTAGCSTVELPGNLVSLRLGGFAHAFQIFPVVVYFFLYPLHNMFILFFQ